MARKQHQPVATSELTLRPLHHHCLICGNSSWVAYHNRRTISTLAGVRRLTLVIRRCQNPECPLYHRPYRPEEEGAFALPGGEFGLDVIAMVGALRYGQHRCVPEIHRELLVRGVEISERSVTNQLERYEELVALRLADHSHLQRRLSEQGYVILAIDGLQPDMGHEVLWVLRDCVSGEVLLARSLLSAAEEELVELLREVAQTLQTLQIGSASAPSADTEATADTQPAKPIPMPMPIPIRGVISDGQRSIRNAVRTALPGVPHQLCQFHYLREAAKPVYEADRHAKKELKMYVRGVRPIERMIETVQEHKQGSPQAAEAQTIRGYCLAVRSALTDDGRPPLSAPGLKLYERLLAIRDSIDRVSKVAEKGGAPSLKH